MLQEEKNSRSSTNEVKGIPRRPEKKGVTQEPRRGGLGKDEEIFSCM